MKTKALVALEEALAVVEVDVEAIVGLQSSRLSLGGGGDFLWSLGGLDEVVSSEVEELDDGTVGTGVGELVFVGRRTFGIIRNSERGTCRDGKRQRRREGERPSKCPTVPDELCGTLTSCPNRETTFASVSCPKLRIGPDLGEHVPLIIEIDQRAIIDAAWMGACRYLIFLL